MPEQCAKIIDTLIEKRKELGLTQKELADASHLTQSVIARMESKKAVPQLDTLLKVVDALGVIWKSKQYKQKSDSQLVIALYYLLHYKTVSISCPAISAFSKRMMLSSCVPKLRKLTLPYHTTD